MTPTPIELRCGSCGTAPATVTLAVSGLRRCVACFDDARGRCDWPRRVAERPAVHGLEGARPTTTQPTITRPRPTAVGDLVRDWKHAQAGEAEP